MGIVIRRTPITCAQFNVLCRSVGWGSVAAENFDVAISRSIACVHAIDGDQIVGFARIVGDVAMYLYVQDVVVAEAWQGQGVGKALMQELHNIARELSPSRGKLILIAAPEVCGFYERLAYVQTQPPCRVLTAEVVGGLEGLGDT